MYFQSISQYLLITKHYVQNTNYKANYAIFSRPLLGTNSLPSNLFLLLIHSSLINYVPHP